ncbi:ATP-binding cassette domain-containing protein, partial [Acinetobacter baumannii]|uniref:ATP-binding cassette domain-containing protein n=1 Tax=Acinetobacter baumannii TaxID=470 RepID=UPI0031F442AB
EKIRVQNLTFKYPLAKKNAIEDINLTIEKSQFAVVCGKSGCGKSTLLRHLKKQMIPYGEKTGQVFIENTEIEEIDERKSVS